MMRRMVVLLAIAGATSAGAQAGSPAGKCRFTFSGPPSTHVESSLLPSGMRNYWIGGGVVARCPQQNMVLQSDSLEVYGDEGRFYFIGRVSYAEPRLKLSSQYLTYFQREERLVAIQNVVATLPTGSQLKGPSLEFLRDIPKVRQQSGIAIGRPTISLVERDAKGRRQPPVTVTGNTVWLQGDSIVASSGAVVVVRPELTATGDSLYLDGGRGLLRLMRSPKVTGTKGRLFTLSGSEIDLLSRQRKIERVLAKGNAEAVSEDLTLKADSIDMRVSDDLLQRAIAWGRGSATATSTTQSITADSIDVLLPGQRAREMHAVRQAVAEGMPDSSKFIPLQRDRLTGDTIVARFDSLAANDTTRKPTIKLLMALGNATSFYQLPARDNCTRRPIINYLRSSRITVTFDSSEVREVRGDSSNKGGIITEPTPDSACAARGAPALSPRAPSTPAPQPGAPSPSTPAVVKPALPARRP